MRDAWCSKRQDVLARVEKMGDLFEPVRKLKQKLPQLHGTRRNIGYSSESREEGASLDGEAEARPRAAKKTAKTAGITIRRKRSRREVNSLKRRKL